MRLFLILLFVFPIVLPFSDGQIASYHVGLAVILLLASFAFMAHVLLVDWGSKILLIENPANTHSINARLRDVKTHFTISFISGLLAFLLASMALLVRFEDRASMLIITLGLAFFLVFILFETLAHCEISHRASKMTLIDTIAEELLKGVNQVDKAETLTLYSRSVLLASYICILNASKAVLFQVGNYPKFGIDMKDQVDRINVLNEYQFRIVMWNIMKVQKQQLQIVADKRSLLQLARKMNQLKVNEKPSLITMHFK